MKALGLLLLLGVGLGAARADDEEERWLEGTKLLKVRVVGPEGAVPDLVRVQFRWSEGGPIEGSGADAVHGEITRRVPAKKCTVIVSHARDERGAAKPWAPARVEVPEQDLDVQVRMGRGLTVEGQVVDEEG